MGRNYADFDSAKAAANQRGTGVQFNGKWVNPDREVLEAKRASIQQGRDKTQEYHRHIAPMKQTFRTLNIPFHNLPDALRSKATAVGISARGKRDAITQLATIHNTNKDRFREVMGTLFPSTRDKDF